MASDDLIGPIRAAVRANPQNINLRVHLAGLLLAAGKTEEALAEAVSILAIRPDHVGALESAGQAARALEKVSQAEGYERLVKMLATPTQSNSVRDVTLSGSQSDMVSNVVPADIISVANQIKSDPVLDSIDVSLTSDDSFADINAFLASVFAEDEAKRVKLSDVGGMHDVKQRLDRSFFSLIRNPELREQYGAALRGGLLLYGPPGCGKTFLARAVAGELNAHFISVGINDVLDPYVGVSEQKVHEIFEQARSHKPTLLFFDELDAVGRARSRSTSATVGNVVTQFLQELDGVNSDNDGLFILGATNQPWDVDLALRRPGRFDRTVLVLPPDVEARVAIMLYHLRDRPVGKVDFAKLAKATDGFSGADLKYLCETATQHAIEDIVSAGGEPRPIGQKDFNAAVASIHPSTGPWFETAKNYATFANASGEYDDLLSYLRTRRTR